MKLQVFLVLCAILAPCFAQNSGQPPIPFLDPQFWIQLFNAFRNGTLVQFITSYSSSFNIPFPISNSSSPQTTESGDGSSTSPSSESTDEVSGSSGSSESGSTTSSSDTTNSRNRGHPAARHHYIKEVKHHLHEKTHHEHANRKHETNKKHEKTHELSHEHEHSNQLQHLNY